MKKIGLATAILLAMTGAHAYQVEVQGQSEHLETDGIKNTFTGDLQGTYYFQNVDSSKGPLKEAAFVNKASNASVGYHYDREVHQGTGEEPKFENHTYGAKAEGFYTTPYASVPVYGSVAYSHSLKDSKNDLNTNDRGDRYALEVGVLPTENFLLAVGYTSVVDQFSLDNFKALNHGLVTATNESDNIGNKQDAVTARAKYVGAIDGTNMYFGFEADGVFRKNRGIYGLSTDLYLNRALSVGATFADTSDLDPAHDHVWGGNINYFINDNVSVGATYTKAKAKNYNTEDSETIGLNAKVRF